MGRTLQPRANYVRDAQTLQRIIMLINADESRPAEWRREQTQHLAAVIQAFNADAVAVPMARVKPSR